MTLEPVDKIKPDKLTQGLMTAIQTTATELENGKMKTYSSPGLEIWAKMIANATAQNGGGHKVTEFL